MIANRQAATIHPGAAWARATLSLLHRLATKTTPKPTTATAKAILTARSIAFRRVERPTLSTSSSISGSVTRWRSGGLRATEILRSERAPNYRQTPPGEAFRPNLTQRWYGRRRRLNLDPPGLV